MGEDTDTAGMLRSMGDALLQAGDLIVISGDLVTDLALRAMVGSIPYTLHPEPFSERFLEGMHISRLIYEHWRVAV